MLIFSSDFEIAEMTPLRAEVTMVRIILAPEQHWSLVLTHFLYVMRLHQFNQSNILSLPYPSWKELYGFPELELEVKVSSYKFTVFSCR